MTTATNEKDEGQIGISVLAGHDASPEDAKLVAGVSQEMLPNLTEKLNTIVAGAEEGRERHLCKTLFEILQTINVIANATCTPDELTDKLRDGLLELLPMIGGVNPKRVVRVTAKMMQTVARYNDAVNAEVSKRKATAGIPTVSAAEAEAIARAVNKGGVN